MNRNGGGTLGGIGVDASGKLEFHISYEAYCGASKTRSGLITGQAVAPTAFVDMNGPPYASSHFTVSSIPASIRLTSRTSPSSRAAHSTWGADVFLRSKARSTARAE